MLKISQKFVYCVAFGGLNDVINQIMYCLNFCKKHTRFLMIDTSRSRLHDDINNYFYLKHQNISCLNISDFFSRVKSLSVSPSVDIQFFESKEIRLKDNSTEDVLIFADYRFTAVETKQFLTLFRLKEELLLTLKERHRSLPEDYISVHIRNTDYSSNVEKFIKDHLNIFKGKNIFLSSDNKESIEQFKKIDANVFTFANIPEYNETTSGGIHKFFATNRYELNCDAILDLILLSLGQKFYFSCEKSGFSKNAMAMNQDKKFKNMFIELLN